MRTRSHERFRETLRMMGMHFAVTHRRLYTARSEPRITILQANELTIYRTKYGHPVTTINENHLGNQLYLSWFQCRHHQHNPIKTTTIMDKTRPLSTKQATTQISSSTHPATELNPTTTKKPNRRSLSHLSNLPPVTQSPSFPTESLFLSCSSRHHLPRNSNTLGFSRLLSFCSQWCGLQFS